MAKGGEGVETIDVTSLSVKGDFIDLALAGRVSGVQEQPSGTLQLSGKGSLAELMTLTRTLLSLPPDLSLAGDVPLEAPETGSRAPASVPARGPATVPLSRMPTGPVGPASVTPAATLACPIVSALDRWIIDAVQPAALRWFAQPVVEIKQISAYSCRGMNGNSNARISEHAFGNALDIASFKLTDGHVVTVKGGWRGTPEEQGFLHDVQLAACVQFTTVLAPGSKVFHYDHIHVDLMRRASRKVGKETHTFGCVFVIIVTFHPDSLGRTEHEYQRQIARVHVCPHKPGDKIQGDRSFEAE